HFDRAQLAGGGEVELAVAVHVGGGGSVVVRWNRQAGARREGPVSVAAEQADRVAEAIRDREIVVAVAVEVGGDHAARRAGGEQRRRAEPRTGAEQDGDLAVLGG